MLKNTQQDQYSMAQTSTEIDRPAEQWKYPYVAAVIDFGSNFRANIIKRSDAKIGYNIAVEIHVNSNSEIGLGFLDEFLMDHQINPNIREDSKSDSYRLEINRRDDVEKLLLLVHPFILVRAEVVNITLEKLIPKLNEGVQKTEEGFYELVGHVDEIRSQTITRREPKYTQEYFKDEFDL